MVSKGTNSKFPSTKFEGNFEVISPCLMTGLPSKNVLVRWKDVLGRCSGLTTSNPVNIGCVSDAQLVLGFVMVLLVNRSIKVRLVGELLLISSCSIITRLVRDVV